MQKVYFIGIGGVGMSSSALLLKEAGWRITGSDAECYGPPRGILERGGIPFTLGYDPENIPPDVDCFVIGRNAKLSPAENAEVRAAHESGKPVYSFPEMLGKLTEDRQNLVVAGSYGKTTVTSLVAHILRHAGVDAGYFIGGEPVPSTWLPAPAALGSVGFFVLEGDEYPSAHDDPRAKFLHLHPHDVILTAVVHDHVNVYPTLESYRQPFRELLSLMSEGGLVVACADEKGALALARESGKTVVTYGVEAAADYGTAGIRYGRHTRFTLLARGTALGEIETGLLGAHNVENVVGAAAWVLERKLASFDAIRAALADFKGVRRRLDSAAPDCRLPVFEGFGSSYEKARSAIEAMRLHFPDQSLVIVFEPHTFGWRNRANLGWYDNVFAGAAHVFVAPPETQGAATHNQLTHEEILTRIGPTAEPYVSPEAAAASLCDDDAVLILTSGDLHGTLPALIEAIPARFPS